MSDVNKEPKKKKIDFKKWQRKWLSPSAPNLIPDVFGGIGDGVASECCVCSRMSRAGRLTEEGKWYCGECK